MLRSTNEIQGYSIQARDGDIGKVLSFLFDDISWHVRYAEVDTGAWLMGRRVLLSPASLGTPDWDGMTVPSTLTKDQIEESPGVEEDMPVSRQFERKLARYYAWPAYWSSYGYPSAAPVPPTRSALDEDLDDDAEVDGDPHLRSTDRVTGYHIKAVDDEIGHIEDFILDLDTWTLRYAVIDTRNWLPGGRKVLISPDWISEVRWADSAIQVELTAEEIRESPEFDPAQPVGRDYEVQLYDFYGRPKYWEQTDNVVRR